MTNAELIDSLRNVYGEKADCYHCHSNMGCYGTACMEYLCHDAADALEADEKRIAKLEKQLPKEGEWIMDENPHDGDCRCSACLIAIDAMHHKLLNALTGGKWWTFYRYCPNCGARMKTVTDCHTLEDGEI